MTDCKKCGQPAAIYLTRYGLGFCSDHFLEFLRNKVKKSIHKYKLLNPYDRIAVALSGGKDSAVLLHILDSIYSEALDLIGLHINLGIEPSNYSKISLNLARELCSDLGREFYCVDLRKEYRISMDLVEKKEKQLKRSLCGICGTFKRYLLNKYSLELDCEKIATGHVLDDEVSVLLMNMINGNVEQLVRTGPNLIAKNEIMITRIKPLYEISELETMIYAQFANLKIQDVECPYSKGASSLKYKKLYLMFENQLPGLGITFLHNFHKKILGPLQEYYQTTREKVRICAICGG
ncbi:MAG: ATP-binding protein, partial [Candidatus Helarchaeota archaeon]